MIKICEKNINIKKEIVGEELRRAYSICSSPKSGELRIAVKAVDNGTFSVFATTILKVGDILGLYTHIAELGRTSMVVHVEAWVRRDRIGLREKVTEGKFKFVALDENGQSTPVPSADELPDYAREMCEL